jgi:hypothetical protein
LKREVSRQACHLAFHCTVAGFRYRPKAQAKILFLFHALLKEIQECLSSHQSQEFSGINGLRLSTNGRFAPESVVRGVGDADLPARKLR